MWCCRSLCSEAVSLVRCPSSEQNEKAPWVRPPSHHHKRKFNLRSTHNEATDRSHANQLTGWPIRVQNSIRTDNWPGNYKKPENREIKMEFFINGHLSVFPGLSKELIKITIFWRHLVAKNDQNSVPKMTLKKSKITFRGAILNLGADKIKINSNIFAMK